MKRNSGFTLIELLVVIAIIGILSSVVLASLNTARGKGADAAIKSNLANTRAQAEIYYDNNGNYGTVAAVGNCSLANTMFVVDTTIANAVTSAASASGGTAACLSLTGANAAWAISVPLRTNSTLSWCVDSTGASKQITGAVPDTTC
jgi:type IV pilus assembly protein PilA